MKIIQEEYHQDVERISGHIRRVRAEEGRIKRQPALEHQNRLLEQIVLANFLSEELDQIKCEETPKLADRDVHWSWPDFEFYHYGVGLVDKVDARQQQLGVHSWFSWDAVDLTLTVLLVA